MTTLRAPGRTKGNLWKNFEIYNILLDGITMLPKFKSLNKIKMNNAT